MTENGWKLGTTVSYPYKLYGGEKAFRLLKDIGYDCMDYGIPCREYSYNSGTFTLSEKEFIKRFESDLALSKEIGLPPSQTHAPFPTWPESNDKDEYEFMMQALEKSLLATAIMEAPYMVMHCAMPMAWNKDTDLNRTKEENRRIFERLLPVAEKYNVKIALENMPLTFIPSCLPEQLTQYIDMMDSPYLVACFDSGHANLSGLDCAAYIRTLGKRLKVLHLHDNDYGRIYKRQCEMDQHTCPFIGTVNWKEVFAALKDVGYSGTLSLESDSFHKHFPDEMFPITERFQFEILKKAAEIYG